MSEKILVTIPYTYKQYRKPENRLLRNCVNNVPRGNANDVEEYYAIALANQYLNRIKADYYCFIADVWEKTWGNCLPKAKKVLDELPIDKCLFKVNEKNVPCVSIEWLWEKGRPFFRGFDIEQTDIKLWVGSTTYWDNIKKQLSLGIVIGEYTVEDKLADGYAGPSIEGWESYTDYYRYLCPPPENDTITNSCPVGNTDTAANLMELDQIDLEPLRAAAEEVLQNYR